MLFTLCCIRVLEKVMEEALAKCQALSGRNSNGDQDCHQRADGVEVMHRR